MLSIIVIIDIMYSNFKVYSCMRATSCLVCFFLSLPLR